jgi:hypothetical protein
LLVVLLSFVALASHAQARFSIGSGECDEISEGHPVSLKTAIRTTQSERLRAYGELLVTRIAGKKETCRATYRLYVSHQGAPFQKVSQIERTIEGAQLAGIDLIGFSPDRSKVGANFWEAEGDWQGQGPVVFDANSGTASYRDLGQRIQERVHGCDQSDDFLGVTNDGQAVFAVPPSIYDDSPDCGDKGMWNFNLKTGALSRVAKTSGVKWER